MTMSTIECPACGTEIEITQALTRDIEKTVLANASAKHQADLDALKKTLEEENKKTADSIATKAKEDAEKKLAIQMEKLEADAVQAAEESKELRSQLTELTKELRESRKAEKSAELEMQKKLASEEDKIREEALKEASEVQRLKMAEKDKQLDEARKSNEDLLRKLNQGSQQTQGEVLELDLEEKLKSEFPHDEIEEVKKGVRGADIKQHVRTIQGTPCGLILWETKNGAWKAPWVAKFKQDLREANAHVGVIVSTQLPEGVEEFLQIEPGVWLAKPSIATRLADALRCTLMEVAAANTLAVGKDEKMEMLYQYMVGPEFKHRVSAIVESYTFLQEEIEREKRWYAQKWAKQEKAIRGVIDNTLAMHGDLQGMTNSALPSIDAYELEAPEENLQGSDV